MKNLNEPDKIVLYCDGSKGTTGKGEYIYTYLLTETGDKTEDEIAWRNQGAHWIREATW